MANGQTRTPATPMEGAYRSIARLLGTALVSGICWLLMQLGGDALTDAQQLQLTGFIAVALFPILEGWGKKLREGGRGALFAVPLLLLLSSGCASSSKVITLALGQGDANRLAGPNITTTIGTEGQSTTICTGGCVQQRATGGPFSDGLVGFLGRLGDLAAGFFGDGPPAQPQPIQLTVTGAEVRHSAPESTGAP